jgi:hypothetical protein
MNKILIPILLCLAMLSCREADKEKHPALELKFTFDEVRAIAAKYGMQDSITPEKHGLLKYFTAEDIEKFCIHVSKVNNRRKARGLFKEKTKDIRSFDDYVALIEQFPLLKEQEVEMQGGEAGYNKWVEASRSQKWHIYRDDKGVLYWIPAQWDKGDLPGERLDNKP